jgi:hypothetical protein
MDQNRAVFGRQPAEWRRDHHGVVHRFDAVGPHRRVAVGGPDDFLACVGFAYPIDDKVAGDGEEPALDRALRRRQTVQVFPGTDDRLLGDVYRESVISEPSWLLCRPATGDRMQPPRAHLRQRRVVRKLPLL